MSVFFLSLDTEPNPPFLAGGPTQVVCCCVLSILAVQDRQDTNTVAENYILYRWQMKCISCFVWQHKWLARTGSFS